jgi:hypothetical protein
MTDATTPSPLFRLLETIERYFDLMYDCDLTKFDDVFLPSASLNGLRDGSLVVWPVAQYRDILAKRQSPQSLGAPRRQEILQIDFAGPDQAVAKVRVMINKNSFVDHLTLINVDSGWRIAFKAYTLEPSTD